ncbi:MAG: NF038122 family metalloprotease [Cyanobacteria bacterium J06614_10]
MGVAVPLAVPLVFLPQSAAQALTFNFDFGRGVPQELQTAAQEAADLWSPLLKDDISVKLKVDYSDLSDAGSVLGGVQPAKVKVKYEDYVDALFEDVVSTNDIRGISSMPLSADGREVLYEYQQGDFDRGEAKLESKEFGFLMDGQFANGSNGKGNRGSRPDFLDNNGNDNNKHIQLTRANAKALSLLKSNESALDALITINSNVNWDFNRSDGIERDRFDLVTVMQHEIGHALGIVSGVDTLDFLATTSGPVDIEDIEKEKFSYLTPIDFYRYSDESKALGVMDITIGGSQKYFSLDGGQTPVTDEFGRVANFSTGSTESQGDGYQGSHWKAADNPLGVMNPILQSGQSIDISQLDLTLLDTIGWDLENSNAKRAAAIGLDWDRFTSDLQRDRQYVVDGLVAWWGNDIPELDAALSEASSELDLKFQEKLQEKFDKLTEKLEDKKNYGERYKEISKFYEEVDKEAEKRNKELTKLPEKIYKTDQEVRKWLALPVDKLAKEMQKADGATINRLSNIVKSLPADEQNAVELKLESAVGLFSDKPDKLVEDLLSTSGPANPIGWSYYRWYWWWLEGEVADDGSAIGDDLQYYLEYGDEESDALAPTFYYATAANGPTSIADRNVSARDVPEPSSILAFFGISVIGAGLLKKGW